MVRDDGKEDRGGEIKGSAPLDVRLRVVKFTNNNRQNKNYRRGISQIVNIRRRLVY